jgi:RHS repeat-associated protein
VLSSEDAAEEGVGVAVLLSAGAQHGHQDRLDLGAGLRAAPAPDLAVHHRGTEGSETDAGPNLVLMQARSYDPTIGRFLQEDTLPIASLTTQGMNRYIYCENDPVNFSDPTGRHPVVGLLFMFAAGAALILATLFLLFIAGLYYGGCWLVNALPINSLQNLLWFLGGAFVLAGLGALIGSGGVAAPLAIAMIIFGLALIATAVYLDTLSGTGTRTLGPDFVDASQVEVHTSVLLSDLSWEKIRTAALSSNVVWRVDRC